MRVLLGWWVVHLPALIVIGFWIAIQMLSSVNTSIAATGDTGGVAYMAHIGGFAAGLVLSFLYRNRARPLPPQYM